MPNYRVIVVLACSAMLSTSLAAQAPMRVAPSGRALTEVTLTLADSAARAAAKPSIIRIDYGQPHLRGRKLLTDSLVPYDKPWRTGANAATTLTTDVDMVIGGATVPKGRYVLQTFPSRSGWKLLVQKEIVPPPATQVPYNPADDLARIDLRQSTVTAPVESLTMSLIPSREPGAPRGQLTLAWGTIALTTDWSVVAQAEALRGAR
ncbi:MAG: DUF2911 domain-containing protein [Gemmatimonadaceae bacterium]|nr:DUF2911 domain-containing protein [Gemmatimonadaceae bacterium]